MRYLQSTSESRKQTVKVADEGTEEFDREIRVLVLEFQQVRDDIVEQFANGGVAAFGQLYELVGG